MSVLEENKSAFDVNGPGLPDRLFGLPFTPESARIILIPAPWEATVSYRTGTARGPEAILRASRQIDFFMRQIPDAWKMGASMLDIPTAIRDASDRMRILVDQFHASSQVTNSTVIPDKVNEVCDTFSIYMRETSRRYLDVGKLVGVVGGDHSTPLGLIRALTEKHAQFGILQIDAHADLRKAYEGFTHSHGSIMYNVLKHPAVQKLVQVGIRDLCEAEFDMIQRAGGRIHTFFDDDLRGRMSRGDSWDTLCQEIVAKLPSLVYISLDIDGLDPRFCPNTGTPVPGGLEFFQAVDLIRTIALSGRTIIGFDLNEVAPGATDDWDANVGARLLWQLCCWSAVSNGFLSANPDNR
ncbi:MAG: agmatinase family protein [Cytophagales bacterium]|nr:agmatinase family protein [Cytophagales bacterium]